MLILKLEGLVKIYTPPSNEIPRYAPGIALPAYLVGSLTHELFGGSRPDGGHGDNPADILVDDDGGGLGGQFFDGVLLEVAQSEREQLDSGDPFSVTRRNRRLAVQLLQTTRVYRVI